MRLKHAIHNQEACDHLMKSLGVFNDWIVTTSFYSALHFVEHKLFPLTDKGDVFPTFDVYWLKKGRKSSKHTAKTKLVANRLTAIGPQYRWLKDSSNNARYKSYLVPDAEAKLAREYLNEIADKCNPTEPIAVEVPGTSMIS